MKWYEPLLAVLAAIWKAISPAAPPVAGAVVGWKLKEGLDAKQNLEKLDEANQAAAVARGWSHIDRVRFLSSRGRLRGVLRK